MKLAAPFLVICIALSVIWWEDAPPDADIVFVNRGEVFTLDPQRMSYLQDFRIAYALYEGLLRWNNHDLSIRPAGANLPHISNDALTYTFELRPDAKWSNGDSVTAHDYVYSWKRLIWPDTAADYSNLFFVIDGAEEFFRWRTDQLAALAQSTTLHAVEDAFNKAEMRFDSTVGISAIDERTLQVRLRQPCAYFLDLICFAVCYPVHRPSVEGWPDNYEHSHVQVPSWDQRRYVSINPVTGRIEQQHGWARPGELVCNGPYVLTEWRYKRDLRLARNPLYHTQEMIRNESVLMLSIEDTNTAVLAFQAGTIDWLSDVSAEYQADMMEERRQYISRYQTEIDALIRSGKTFDEALASLPEPESGERRDIHSFPTFGSDFYSFNCREFLADGRPNPFANAAVRRAFALSVDKHAIVQNVTRLNEPVLNTQIPLNSIPGYKNPKGLEYDPDRARDEFKNAGWIDRDGDGTIENENGEPFPVVDLLWTTNTPRYKWMSLELKSQWERELGVRVELRGADTKFYKEDLKLGKFMIARGRWYGDYSDPTTFLDISRTGDGNNDRGYSNPQFDAILERAANERDPHSRMRMLEEAERYLFEDEVPLLPICQLVQLYMYEPGNLTGLSTHPRLIQYLWQMEVQNKD